MEEFDEYENGSSRKRARMEKICVLCEKSAYPTEKEEEYTVLLINNLVSPFERGVFIKDDKLISFEFCLDCGALLEDLVELKRALQFVSESINAKLKEIKYSILRNRNLDANISNEEAKKFRTFATRDMCPVVRLDLMNVLVKNKSEYEDLDSTNFYNNKIRSQVIEIDPGSNEYFDEEEEVEEFEPWDEQTIEYRENNCFETSCSILSSENLSSSNSNSLRDCPNSFNNSLPEDQEWTIKPKLKYSQLAIIAIANSKAMRATLNEIYDFILVNFPYFRNCTLFKPCLIRALNSPIFETESAVRICNSSKDCLTLTGIDSGIIEEISKLLKSFNVLQTMAFPERQKEFIEGLWKVLRKKMPEKIHRIDSAIGAKNRSAEEVSASKNQAAEAQWQRPPFPLSQIIFIALCNCEGKRGTAAVIVECIRNTFPFFMTNNPVNTWRRCLHTTMFINKCFERTAETINYDALNDVWTVNEDEAENMRKKIKGILESEKLRFSTYMATPEVSLRTALRRSSAATMPKKSNRSFNTGKSGNQSLSPAKNNSNQLQNGKDDSAVCTNPDKLEIAKNSWQRPPLNFAQIIFLALSNCPGLTGNANEIISKISEIFPFASDVQIKWENTASTVLFYNENFVRTNAKENEIPNSTHIWTLNNAVADKMRKDIKDVLKSSCLIISDYMRKPAEVLNNASIYAYCSPRKCDKKGKTHTHVTGFRLNSKPGPVVNGRNGWLRPPFNFVQTIFIALSNCHGKSGNSVEIIERIRALFPWFLNVNMDFTWIKTLTTILFTNDNFIRANESVEVIPLLKRTWKINEKLAYSMRSEIRSIVGSDNINSLCHYIMHPDETIRKALTAEQCLPNGIGNDDSGMITEKENVESCTPQKCAYGTMILNEETPSSAESVIIKGEIEIEEEFTREAT